MNARAVAFRLDPHNVLVRHDHGPAAVTNQQAAPRTRRRLRQQIAQPIGPMRLVALVEALPHPLQHGGEAFVGERLYSVLAYAVSRRTSEIGLRVAWGARGGQVVSLILRSGLRLVALGLAIGLVGAAAATRLIQRLLFNVQGLEPAFYIGVAVAFGLIAALACLVPSVRASRIDPLVALRPE